MFCPQHLIISHLEIRHLCAGQYKSLHAFGNTIGEIANVLDREVTATDLLAAAPFKTISYNDKNIITGFTRQ